MGWRGGKNRRRLPWEKGVPPILERMEHQGQSKRKREGGVIPSRKEGTRGEKESRGKPSNGKRRGAYCQKGYTFLARGKRVGSSGGKKKGVNASLEKAVYFCSRKRKGREVEVWREEVLLAKGGYCNWT